MSFLLPRLDCGEAGQVTLHLNAAAYGTTDLDVEIVREGKNLKGQFWAPSWDRRKGSGKSGFKEPESIEARKLQVGAAAKA